MNTGDIAEVFIRAAETDRNTSEPVGPAQARLLARPCVCRSSWSLSPFSARLSSATSPKLLAAATRRRKRRSGAALRISSTSGQSLQQQ